MAFNALNASLALTPTNGNPPLKMLPLFTWLVSRRSGGKFYGCSLEVRSVFLDRRAQQRVLGLQ